MLHKEGQFYIQQALHCPLPFTLYPLDSLLPLDRLHPQHPWHSFGHNSMRRTTSSYRTPRFYQKIFLLFENPCLTDEKLKLDKMRLQWLGSMHIFRNYNKVANMHRSMLSEIMFLVMLSIVLLPMNKC